VRKKIIDLLSDINTLIAIPLGFAVAFVVKIVYGLSFSFAVGLWFVLSSVFFFIIKKANLIPSGEREFAVAQIAEELAKYGLIEVPIEKIAHIWQEKKEITVSMDKLAKNWRDERKIEINKNYTSLSNTSTIEFHTFFQQVLDKYYSKTDEQGRTIIEYPDEYYLDFMTVQHLLLKLDKEAANCPSVVGLNKGAADPDREKSSKTAYSVLGIKLDSKNDKSNSNDKNNNNNEDSLPSSWELLRGVSLLEHTIHVAKHIIKIIEKDRKSSKDAALYLADAVIVALAHDIGKLLKEKSGRFEPHPELSAELLRELLENIKIERSKENKPLTYNSKKINTLVKAVKDHHSKSEIITDNEKEKISETLYKILLRYLKEADSRARKEELQNLIRIMGYKEQFSENEQKTAKGKKDQADRFEQITEEVDLPPKPGQKQNPVDKESNHKPFQQQSEHLQTDVIVTPPNFYLPEFEEEITKSGIFSANGTMNRNDNEDMDMSNINLICDWLDDSVDDILKLIESRINYVKKTPTGKAAFEIFSIKDVVLMTSNVMFKIMWFFGKRNGDMAIISSMGIKAVRLKAALLLADKFRETGFFQENLVKKGYFGGNFYIDIRDYNSDNIKSFTGYYTPLSLQKFSEAFNTPIAVYEARKRSKEWDSMGILRKFAAFHIKT